MSNAIVIVDRKMDQPEIDRLAKLFGYGNIQIKEGVLNNLELYFDNEPAVINYWTYSVIWLYVAVLSKAG